MAKIFIAQTPQYEIYVDKAINRIYLKIIGFWRNPEQVPLYIDDWKKAIMAAGKGFTLLTMPPK